ncbi:flagellar hook-length control protein FliK, partial [Methylobacterium sp. Leaf118]|uniref:flagellar hook-length control protein FliK n=1 Tax=Methylobacterium sp. Leaf118 TaxID=2876562 RepID=UPI001E28BF34
AAGSGPAGRLSPGGAGAAGDQVAAFEAALAEAGGEAGSSGTAPAAVAPPAPPPLAPSGPAAAPAAVPADAQAPNPAPPPIPLGAVPMTIGLRSLAGANRFAIRLDPVELGRIEVSLDLDRAGGTARAHLVVDRPETLALLQRDAGTLQQALAQAGFEATEGIGLSLRGESGDPGARQGGQPGSDGHPAARPGARTGAHAGEPPAPIDPAAFRRLRAVGGLDIRI